jgi:beta-lactamase regulating signal transducer with metallopeptidase domain
MQAGLPIQSLRWVVHGAFDGTLLAAAVWLVSLTVLRRASGRVQALLWLLGLLGFVSVRPFQIQLQVHALPLHAVLQQSLASGGDVTAALGSSMEPTLLPSAVFHTLVSGAAVIYAASVVLLALRLAIRQTLLRRQIARYAGGQPALLSAVEAAARTLSLARVPEVRVAEAPVGPFTLGPARPVIVLPHWLCVPGPRLEAVLLHELAHLKRRDHLWMWLEHGVSLLFFFWPPVRWVGRRLGESRELACDELAIRHGGFAAVEYGRHLLDVVAAAAVPVAASGALGIGRRSSRLERRIDRLLEESWLRERPGVDAAVLGLLALCACLGLRPARQAGSAALDQVLVPLADGAAANAPNMSVDPSWNASPPCVLQGCGTQCAPSP